MGEKEEWHGMRKSGEPHQLEDLQAMTDSDDDEEEAAPTLAPTDRQVGGLPYRPESHRPNRCAPPFSRQKYNWSQSIQMKVNKSCLLGLDLAFRFIRNFVEPASTRFD